MDRYLADHSYGQPVARSVWRTSRSLATCSLPSLPVERGPGQQALVGPAHFGHDAGPATLRASARHSVADVTEAHFTAQGILEPPRSSLREALRRRTG